MRAAALSLMLATAAVQSAQAAPTAHNRVGALQIRGSVLTNCTLSTAPLTFSSIGIGYVHAPGNAILRQSSLAVRCTKGAAVQISMNAGLYGSAAGSRFGSRSMKALDGSYLGYELCHDSGCANIWSTQGYTYASASASGSSLPVWGRIVTGQAQAKQGSYADSVTVTVNF